ncbi:hypothetical protein HKX48_000577 [Thoreauomyces humboldtii]|nr:hypothetical protein HKX48_000577 [Thoreauomyces humboldtii]
MRFPPPLGEAEGDLRHYRGSCCCGKVQIVVSSKPLSDVQVKQDDCSICSKIGYTLIYPTLSSVSLTGADNLTGYRFGRRFLEHRFCSTCGVNVVISLLGPPEEVVATFSEERKEMVRRKLDCVCVNVAALDLSEEERAGLTVLRERDDSEPAYVLPE